MPDALPILLEDIWAPKAELEDYKVHFAKWNGDRQPLDAWVRDRDAWVGWQEYPGAPVALIAFILRIVNDLLA